MTTHPPQYHYSEPARAIAGIELPWTEFMHYLYLPICMSQSDISSPRLPPNLEFTYPLIAAALFTELTDYRYVYLSAVRGFATPGNALNRPGWHCDGFGTDDINYVWWDGVGTDFASHEFTDIEQHDSQSMIQFAAQAQPDPPTDHPQHTLYRITPYTVHRAPLITLDNQGMRSFLKLSFSTERYNLLGNSHNYLFDYDWPMHAREKARNDPHKAADFYTP